MAVKTVPGGRPRRPYSLTRRLITTTVGSSVVVGLVSTAIVLALTWKESSESFDDVLKQGARLVMAMAGDGAGAGSGSKGGGGGSGRGSSARASEFRGPDMRIDYQIVAADGRLLRRGHDAPAQPFLDPHSKGKRYYDLRVDGKWWRVYVLRNDEQGLTVMVGQEWEERVDLLLDVLEALAWPLLGLWVVLGLANWWQIRRLVAPLGRATRAIAAKSPDDLSPMPDDEPALEIRSVIQSLNLLLERLSRALDHERRFTADAAHELRTPLAALASRVQLMQRSHQSLNSAALAADLQRVRDDVTRSTALIENLLQLARLDPQSSDAAAMTAVDTAELFDEAVRACQPAATARQVHITVDDSLGSLIGNRTWLFSALRNLLDNAIRHGAAGGRVELLAARHGGIDEITVRDDGPGVPEADLERLSQRFYRVLGTEAQGNGLGLSIVARVAQLHGGRLRFGRGADGRGLAVTLEMPRR